MIMGSFGDHPGMVLGQSVGQCSTSFSLFRDMFGHTVGTLLKNCFGEIEISKSSETLPDHFSIKNKASHEVERQIRRLLFPFDFSSEKCCLIMSVNRTSLFAGGRTVA